MIVNVKVISGRQIEVATLEPSSNILQLKEKIEEMEGIPIIQQCLVFGGTKLDDSKSLEECKIVAGSTVHMVLALRAGN